MIVLALLKKYLEQLQTVSGTSKSPRQSPCPRPDDNKFPIFFFHHCQLRIRRGEGIGPKSQKYGSGSFSEGRHAKVSSLCY